MLMIKHLVIFCGIEIQSIEKKGGYETAFCLFEGPKKATTIFLIRVAVPAAAWFRTDVG